MALVWSVNKPNWAVAGAIICGFFALSVAVYFGLTELSRRDSYEVFNAGPNMLLLDKHTGETWMVAPGSPPYLVRIYRYDKLDPYASIAEPLKK